MIYVNLPLEIANCLIFCQVFAYLSLNRTATQYKTALNLAPKLEIRHIKLYEVCIKQQTKIGSMIPARDTNELLLLTIRIILIQRARSIQTYWVWRQNIVIGHEVILFFHVEVLASEKILGDGGP